MRAKVVDNASESVWTVSGKKKGIHDFVGVSPVFERTGDQDPLS